MPYLHLKKNGFQQNDLVLVYKSMIRPIAEYCSSVFYSMITASDSLEIERIKMQALKTIFGWRKSYSELLARSRLERLDDRREAACVSFAKKASENPRLQYCMVSETSSS